ncbi:MAG: T9SS C-terminal target domain-containing protein [Calditrichaeota bacterium]|nr:MAG: T9SS C-terminal target domain-containing protein [Calditrichota bacterium]
MLTATDSSGLSASDTFLVTITPVNDPPVVSGLPDTLRFAIDTTLGVWNFVSDPETPDSLLSYQFSSSNDSLLLAFNPVNGILTLSAAPNFAGFVQLTISVTDDSGATALGIMTVEIQGGLITFTDILSDNWNLLNLPLQVNDPFYLTLFPNAIPGTLYGWDGSYLAGDTLYPGAGYWLRLSAADTVQLTGTRIDSLTLHLRKGWNLIGGISRDVPLSEVVDPNQLLIPGTLYGFDGVYYSSDTLREGEGYWVNTYDSGTVILPVSGGAFPVGKAGALPSPLTEAEVVVIRISNPEGVSQELLLADESLLEEVDEQWLLTFSLPPLPPGDGFDIRFNNHSRLAVGEMAEVLLQSREYPLQLTLKQLPSGMHTILTVEEVTGGQGNQSYRLSKEGESLLVQDERVKKLKLHLQSGATPSRFSLKQNYPNPFNPSTTIPFEISKNSTVKLEIYDVTGKKVKTLLNKEMSPGSYSVRWDGVNKQGLPVSSGIYFYRLKANGFQAIRKMVLLK